MKIKLIILSVLALVFVIYQLSAKEEADLRIDNAFVYQPESKQFSTLQRIYIKDGKVSAVESVSKKPRNAKVVMDAEKKYVTSGLTDLHVHFSASGSAYGADYQYLPVDSHLNSYLALGVTSVVDLFSPEVVTAQVKGIQSKGTTSDVYFAGTLFTNPQGHGTQFGSKAYVVRKDADIEDLWAQHLASNPHVTKAVLESFQKTRDTLSDSQLGELGKRSKEANLPFFVHISTLEDGKRAVKAGATALAHGVNFETIDQEFIDLMVKHNVVYIPTLAVYHNHADEFYTQALSRQINLLEPVHSKMKKCLLHDVSNPAAYSELAWERKNVAYENVKALHESGVIIGAGSDSGNPYTLHGVGLHNELQLLRKSGMTNANIINSATINGAAALNRTDIMGKVEPGFIADLIITKKNPLDDLSAFHSISKVIKSGEIINREKLIKENQKIEPQGASCEKVILTTTLAEQIIYDNSTPTKWSVLSDSLFGGGSNTTLAESEQGTMFSTSLGNGGTYGAWSGAELKFVGATDVSKFTGIEIKIKASQAIYFSVYQDAVKDWDHYQTVISSDENIQTIRVPFSDLKQVGYGVPREWSTKAVTGINILWRNQPQANSSTKNIEAIVEYVGYYQ